MALTGHIRVALKPKWILVAVTFLSSRLGEFLRFIWWDLSDWLVDLAIVCALVVSILVLISLLRRRWENAAIFVVTLFVSIWTPSFGDQGDLNALLQLGFRIHIVPVEKYLSQCDLVKFSEGDVPQTVGFCQGHGFSSSDYGDRVIYDTSGELLKPESEKTAEWRLAMDKFFAEDVLATSTGRTVHIWRDFYLVRTYINEERG
jgi:hypothetical protein